MPIEAAESAVESPVASGHPGTSNWSRAGWLLASLLGLAGLWAVSGGLYPDWHAHGTLIGLCLLIAVTSFLSGIFGQAGGVILIGASVILLDLATAMYLVTAVLVSCNLWRSVQWRREIRWAAVLTSSLGAAAGCLLLLAIQWIPSKASILVFLGAIPLCVGLIPRAWWPSIESVSGQLACGFIGGVAQICGGSSAPITDIFFQSSSLTRVEIVATKGCMIVPLQFLRAAFFMVAFAGSGSSLPPWFYALAVAVAIPCTFLGGALLKSRFTDANFRRWSWRISITASVVFLAQGLRLMWS